MQLSRPAQKKWFTTLRGKTIVLLLAAVICLSAGVYLPLRIILLNHFAELEVQNVETNLEQVQNAINADLKRIDTSTVAWSTWDDTYSFIEDRNPEYITANVNDDFFITFNVNLMLFVNQQGEVVFGKMFDLASQKEVELPGAVFAQLLPQVQLYELEPNSPPTLGIVLMPDGPMLIAVRPILTSIGQGPSRGSVVFGRYLDAAESENIQALTQFPFSVYRIDDAEAPADVKTMQALLQPQRVSAVQPIDARTIVGYRMISDLASVPRLIVRVPVERKIYARGQTALLSMTAALFVSGTVASLLILLLLERLILARVARLSSEVAHIGKANDLAARVSVRGSDELAHLGDAINQTLIVLEQIQTERRSHIEALETAREVAETANRAKSTFLATMSHELRTPLHAILGFTQVMQLEAPRRGHTHLLPDLTNISRSAHHLLTLIGDILDLSKIEAGKITVRPEEFEVAPFMNDLIMMTQPLIDKQGNRCLLELDPRVTTMTTDRHKLRQILLNLLSNAAKFTEQGTIMVRITPTQRNGVPWLTWAVSDTGIGISEAAQTNIFMPFTQVNDSSTRPYSGTGLGLALANHLCVVLGGTLNVSSVEGQGSTFTIHLPQTLTEVPPSPIATVVTP